MPELDGCGNENGNGDGGGGARGMWWDVVGVDGSGQRTNEYLMIGIVKVRRSTGGKE